MAWCCRLLVRSFVGLVNVNPGYDARDVTAFQIVWPAGYVSNPTRLYEEVLSRLDADPATQAVGAADVLPVAGAGAFHIALGGLPAVSGSEPLPHVVHHADQLGVDFDQPSMVELISASVARPRFNMFVLGAFAIVALTLAIVGIYGVLSHAVTQRTREIGIRMAMGAAPSRVRNTVVRQSLTLTGIGLVIGSLGAAAVTRYLESMLFELAPLDPSTFAAVAVLFLLVALFAAYLPAARASRVDPLVALRQASPLPHECRCCRHWSYSPDAGTATRGPLRVALLEGAWESR